MSRTVCLVTPGHVSSTPRLVKEADALVEAGYRVHVVHGRHFAPADALDTDILSNVRWTHTAVDFRGGLGVAIRKVLRRVARRAVTTAPLANAIIAARAHHAETPRLIAEAARIEAHFYFGHCLGGLPVAARAAAVCHVPYGFDAEDFHDAETTEASADRTERTLRRTLQQRYLPGCAVMTAASPLIAIQYTLAYGVPAPTTVLNVFPLVQAPAVPAMPVPISEKRPARFYWFSQTIGLGRGLEPFLAVLARMRTPAELQLRGFPVPGYAEHLQALATRAGLVRPIVFLPPGPPAEMARMAAMADIGLSLEQSQPLNRDLCLTNKIFTYLLAGIPQLLTPTSAQRAIASDLGAAALLSDGDAAGTAARLDAFFSEPDRVAIARNVAWMLVRKRYCWDREKAIFLRSVDTATAP